MAAFSSCVHVWHVGLWSMRLLGVLGGGGECQVVVLSTLRHPNILQRIGLTRTGSGVLDAIVTELANGGSLRAFLTSRKEEVRMCMAFEPAFSSLATHVSPV
jgi:hypothetical protein